MIVATYIEGRPAAAPTVKQHLAAIRMFAESHLTRRLFGAMLQRIWAFPVPAG